MPTSARRADLLFPADPASARIARELYALARDLPLICPHGHVDPAILADDAPFPDPARLLIVPDHYLTRMLLSQGITAGTSSACPTRDGAPSPRPTAGRSGARFAAHWHLFRGTPSRLWLEQTFATVFDVAHRRCGPDTADEVYDAIAARLAEPEFRPRALFERFNIEVLATTESPAGRPGRARQAGRRRLGRAGRRVDHHVPAGRRGGHGVGRLGRPGRPARRDRRRGHRHLRRLPGRAAPAPARRSSPPARPRSDHGHPTAAHARC